MSITFDVIIIGGGAAGLMCAIEAGKRGRSVLLIEHSKKLAEKIRISGGGRSNFTNMHTAPETFLSQNKHFCKSALMQYTQNDFIELVQKHGIPYHEKKLGQLFCDESSKDIIDMLYNECKEIGVQIKTNTSVEHIAYIKDQYILQTNVGEKQCTSLVIATGGLSIPKIGASKFGYDIARQFGINVINTRAGLVPLTFQSALLKRCKELTGLSVEAKVSCGNISFSEGLLFTHRGLSGPSILQISSYWQEGQDIIVNLAQDIDATALLKEKKKSEAKLDIQTVLSNVLPKRLARSICEDLNIQGRIADLPDKHLETLANAVNAWCIKPSGTEGYRTAEVTIGGVDCDELSSKTMESKKQSGLYFIGEVIDVTGHLGGFNFQWAWSSGYSAGQNV